MLVKKANLSFWSRFAFSFAIAGVFTSCQEFKAETPTTPQRAVAASRSTVSGVGGEVSVATGVTIRLLDARGYGVPKIIPTVSVVNGAGVTVANTSGGACTASDSTGASTCTVTSNVPGSYYIKVNSPAAFTSASTVTFTQVFRGLRFTTSPSASTVAGVNFAAQPVVQFLDGAGQLMTSGTNSVTLTLSSGGAFNGTATVAAVAGVATFAGLSVNTAGSYTFMASSGTATVATSSSFAITAAAASQLAFTTQPSASTAAYIAFAQQPIVTYQDAFGNTASSTCNVTITKTTGAGTLLGTATKTAVAGVADFAGYNLRVNTTAGGANYVLTATPLNACAAFAPATTSAFTITLSGVPFSIEVYTQASDASLNGVWSTQPVVRVLDSSGNLATTDSQTIITLSKGVGSPAGGTLNGGLSKTVSSGVATFSGLSIQSTAPGDAGTYNLAFDASHPDVGVSYATATDSIVIDSLGMVGAALLFETQPAGASINASMDAFRVKIVDANGSECSICTDTVTINYYYGSAPGGVMNGTAARAALGTVDFPGLSFTTAGTKQLSATAPGLTTAYSNLFVVDTYGDANKLAFGTQPSSGGSTGQAAWATQPTVRVQDVAGNTVAEDNSTQITLACVSPSTGCTLIGTKTVQVVNGVATFAGLRTAETGLANVVLEATSSPVLLSAQSSSFTGNVP